MKHNTLKITAELYPRLQLVAWPNHDFDVAAQVNFLPTCREKIDSGPNLRESERPCAVGCDYGHIVRGFLPKLDDCSTQRTPCRIPHNALPGPESLRVGNETTRRRDESAKEANAGQNTKRFTQEMSS